MVRFDDRFASLSAEDFVGGVLVERLRARYVVVGEDFRDGILFVPEVLLAANAMKLASGPYRFRTTVRKRSGFHPYRINNTLLLTGYNHSTPRSVTIALSSSGTRNFLPPHSGIAV